MNFRPLGNTDLNVSELCLGTMNFGWRIAERTSGAILDAFRSAGGNFFQAVSAPARERGFAPLAISHAEKHLGAWLASRRVQRSSVVLATRLVLRDPPVDDRPLAEVVRESCEASLRRLRTDHLDLFLCEWSPALASTDVLLAALHELVRDGLVRHVGASGFPAWRVAEARARATAESRARVEMVQHDFSLIQRLPFEAEYRDLCRENGMGFIARSPLGRGFLAHRPPLHTAGGVAEREAWISEQHRNLRHLDIRNRLAGMARRRDATVAQMALAWVLAHDPITAAVIGVSSVHQLDDLVSASKVRLSEDDLSFLDDSSTRTSESTSDRGLSIRFPLRAAVSERFRVGGVQPGKALVHN